MTTVKTLWGPAAIGTVATTNTTLAAHAMNDADNAIMWSFSVPKDGTITDVGFLVTATTGTPPAFNAGIVTVDATGNATTTAYGGSAIKSYTPGTGAGWRWVTLDTPATANAGDWAAVHIYPGGTPPDGSNNMSIARGAVADLGMTKYYTTGWSVNTPAGAFAVKYQDGSIHGVALSSATAHVQVRSNTTPDEVGCLFQVPAAMTCTGARFSALAAGWGTAAAVDVVLYNAAGTPVATSTIGDKDYVDDSSVVNVFWDGVALTAATDYRLIIKPTVAANGDIITPKWTFESTAALAAIPEGARWQYTSQTDAGGWSNDNVSVCPMALWVSDITFSAGTGGGGEYAYIG